MPVGGSSRAPPREVVSAALCSVVCHFVVIPRPPGYSQLVRRARILAALAFVAAAWTMPPTARAGGLELDIVGTRSLGRAGAMIVGADGSSALAVNPAGMARRESPRFQLGAAVIDSDIEFGAPVDGSPTINNRAGPTTVPELGAQVALGPLIVGAAYLELGDLARTLPAPAQDQPAADVGRLFPHRYAGLSLRHQKQAVMIGAAVRVTDWLGIGVAGAAGRVDLSEVRHVWAGFDGIDPIGNAERDLRLELSGTDAFVPGYTASALIAPPQIPVELAVSTSLFAAAELEGDAVLAPTSNEQFPAAQSGGATARAKLASTAIVRAGLRYLGERLIAEASGELSYFLGSGDNPTWQTTNLRAIDETLAEGELSSLTSLVTQRDHGAVRGSVEVDAVGGFLWLTGGYAYRTSTGSKNRLAPGFADLDSHTVAVGVEGTWEGTTLTVGYARTMARAVSVDAADSGVSMVNPFDAGTIQVGGGTYDLASDAFALSVELSFE